MKEKKKVKKGGRLTNLMGLKNKRYRHKFGRNKADILTVR